MSNPWASLAAMHNDHAQVLERKIDAHLNADKVYQDMYRRWSSHRTMGAYYESCARRVRAERLASLGE